MHYITALIMSNLSMCSSVSQVEDAICSKQKQPEKKHRIRIHLDKKPTIFHSAEWCKMMRGLGFITEDTGTTNKIEMCQLFVPPTVPVSVLTGFYSLLESLVGKWAAVCASICGQCRQDDQLRNASLNL